jgi:glutamate---cysteine ligase / carboxylate-amine ligase
MDRHLFECIGIELEYMIVDQQSLSVRPTSDQILTAAAGELTGEVDRPPLAWSNELALHVLELKTNGPAARLVGLANAFQSDVREVNRLAAPLQARLLPTAMHPWMDPDRELRLWPHDYNPVYEAFHRIFDCRGHGWANLQSCHINLPFCGAEEFGRLHAAIRLILPLLPALAASSPICNGQPTGWMDTRMEVYRGNAKRIPEVSGTVIPEAVFSPEDYQSKILQPLYQAIAPHDPEAMLQHEWLNARGAIARFQRDAIEIRVIDVQECPAADIAIAAATVAVLRLIVDERWSRWADQQTVPTETLASILHQATRHADQATIEDPHFLQQLGWSNGPTTASALWQHLIQAGRQSNDRDLIECSRPLELILREGPLARRIERAAGKNPERFRLHDVYSQLADCLQQGKLFDPIEEA